MSITCLRLPSLAVFSSLFVPGSWTSLSCTEHVEEGGPGHRTHCTPRPGVVLSAPRVCPGQNSVSPETPRGCSTWHLPLEQAGLLGPWLPPALLALHLLSSVLLLTCLPSFFLGLTPLPSLPSLPPLHSPALRLLRAGALRSADPSLLLAPHCVPSDLTSLRVQFFTCKRQVTRDLTGGLGVRWAFAQ